MSSSSPKSQLLCPICKRAVTEPHRTQGPAPSAGAPAAKAQKSYFPFCSDRCQLIDLGRWLDGKYGVESEIISEEQ